MGIYLQIQQTTDRQNNVQQTHFCQLMYGQWNFMSNILLHDIYGTNSRHADLNLNSLKSSFGWK